eukprot:TRINITY_DN495_c0_g1_i1.p1 TRINITY_DN495_c0_g1~~TRINITY_DN495_c0_g1_i1.p1  ORF type:complete len:158 (-),score=26.72 TRINITY_DN495_c0_g1_i1:75-548(-)
MSNDGQTLLVSLFDRLFRAQERRPLLYRKFEQAFKEYKEKGDFQSYVEVAKQVAVAFNEVSKEIISVENEFKSNNYVDVGNKIRELQLLEKDKLSLESELQIVTKENQDQEEYYREYEAAVVNRSLIEMKIKRGEIIEQILEVIEELKEFKMKLLPE